MQTVARLIAASVLACTVAFPLAALAQQPGPLPPLTAEQSAVLRQAMAAERVDVDDRRRAGLLRDDDAERLLRWREWQIARQIAGEAPVSAVVERQTEADRERAVYERRYARVVPAWGVPVWGVPYGGPVIHGSVCVGGMHRRGYASLCF